MTNGTRYFANEEEAWQFYSVLKLNEVAYSVKEPRWHDFNGMGEPGYWSVEFVRWSLD